ncbi:MAG: ABC transporter ATP-binding protein, partial [Maritimibacter sp.]|nr:ABC transporter ATP-binding protein [Maritimibacter sp.]
DGLVMQVGTPMELYHEPANLFVAGFLGAPSMNFLDVTVEAVEGGEARVGNGALDPITVSTRGRSFAPGDRAVLGLRPQYLHPVADAEGQLHGTILLTERLGAETIVEVRLKDGGKLIAALSEDRVYEPGEKIGFNFDSDRALLFAPED